MSWKSRLENVQFTIKTGDGKEFSPLWKNGLKTKNYNFSKYDFINVDGSLIDRKKQQSSKYPLKFWFQGDDNIEQADAFEASAADSRPWEIKHPFYGNITGQPLNLTRNDNFFNSTEITVEFWESIIVDYPNPQSSIKDDIVAGTSNVQTVSAASYASDLVPASEDVQILQDSITQITSVFDKLFDNETFSDYQTLKSNAERAVDNLISSPLIAITSLNSLLLSPSLFVQSVRGRVSALKEAFDKLVDTLGSNPTVSTKLYFESQSAVCLSAMAQAAADPLESDYITRSEIENINTVIIDTYDRYLQLLDDSQVRISDVENTYHASTTTQLLLYDLITETTGNLFTLAFSAKQERTVEVNKHTNLISLTHRYLGLDASDENIELFRQTNNIKNDELLLIKKGRVVTYFV